MRDKQTIEVALEAAETGHMVYSTLHTMMLPRRWKESSACFRWKSRTRFAGAWRNLSATLSRKD